MSVGAPNLANVFSPPIRPCSVRVSVQLEPSLLCNQNTRFICFRCIGSQHRQCTVKGSLKFSRMVRCLFIGFQLLITACTTQFICLDATRPTRKAWQPYISAHTQTVVITLPTLWLPTAVAQATKMLLQSVFCRFTDLTSSSMLGVLEALLQTQLGVFVFSNFIIACCAAVAAITTVSMLQDWNSSPYHTATYSCRLVGSIAHPVRMQAAGVGPALVIYSQSVPHNLGSWHAIDQRFSGAAAVAAECFS